MDKCIGQIALSKEEAVPNFLEHISFSPAAEEVSLRDAAWRIAAKSYYSKQTLPSIKSASKDGIAVHSADFENGMPDTSDWQEGRDYIHCYTGIGIKGDFDAMIKIEQINFDDHGRIHIDPLKLDKDLVAPAGRLVKEGDLLLSANETVTPFYLTRLACGGYTDIEVLKKPVVAFIPTGNELVRAGEEVPEGLNVDTNSIMFEAKIKAFGGIPIMYDIVPDDPGKISSALEDALEKADIIAINGGSSKGLHDYTVEVVERHGKILSHMLKSGPGAHTSCTVADNGKPIVGIAGPSIGAEALTDWFIKPLIDKYNGKPFRPILLKAVYEGAALEFNMHIGEGWCRRLRGHVSLDEKGRFTVKNAPFTDPAAVNYANCFIAVGNEGVKEGEEITVEMRWPYSLESLMD